MRTAAALAAAGALLAAGAFAAPDPPPPPPPPPLQAAGSQPSQAQAQAAVIDWLRKTAQDPKDIERTRFLSGPHLVTGITLGGSREQAWEMCVVTGDGDIARGTPALGVKPVFLRGTGDGLAVIPVVNWKTYDSRC